MGDDQVLRELTGFNPRARTGRDKKAKIAHDEEAVFQSTRPHGARHQAKGCRTFGGVFQSTRPHGARLHSKVETVGFIEVSIHAPARGATACTAAVRGSP